MAKYCVLPFEIITVWRIFNYRSGYNWSCSYQSISCFQRLKNTLKKWSKYATHFQTKTAPGKFYLKRFCRVMLLWIFTFSGFRTFIIESSQVCLCSTTFTHFFLNNAALLSFNYLYKRYFCSMCAYPLRFEVFSLQFLSSDLPGWASYSSWYFPIFHNLANYQFKFLSLPNNFSLLTLKTPREPKCPVSVAMEILYDEEIQFILGCLSENVGEKVSIGDLGLYHFI